MANNNYSDKKNYKQYFNQDSSEARKTSRSPKATGTFSGKTGSDFQGKPKTTGFSGGQARKGYSQGSAQGKPLGGTKTGFVNRQSFPMDPGYEENPAGGSQRGRGFGRAPMNQNRSTRPGASDRFGKPGFSKDAEGFRGSPASQRFGPGSMQGKKPFGKPAQRQYPVPARMVAPKEQPLKTPVETPSFDEDLPQVNLLTGRNPIREAIKTGRDLEKLMIAKGELSGSAREIVSLAKKAGIMIQSVERSRLDQIAKNHQGMIGFASAYQYSTVEEILDLAKQRGEDPFIIVLDQITDPHNLGAVIRTAACAGAHGVIVPMHRAVGLTPAAVKASAGAVEHMKVARVTNLNQTIKSLQKQGIWFYAAQTDGEDYRTAKFAGPCALVIGSEGEGVSQLTSSICDKSIFIPMRGEIGSLNASVAAGILMYAVYDARNPKQ